MASERKIRLNTTIGPRLRAFLLLLLVAVASFFVGVVTDRLLLGSAGLAEPGPEAQRGRILVRGDDGDGPRQPGLRVIRLGLPEQLAEELDLSPEQRSEIERILAEDQAALRAEMERMEPVLAEIIESSRRRISEVLTDEQVVLWRESEAFRLRPGQQQQRRQP